jgi:hypothetical protein
MFDPQGRNTVQMRGRHFTLTSRLRRVLSGAAERARAASSPFKIGDYLAGDDPFNGCQEGVVAVINGSSIGLRATPPTSGTVVYYDYRQLRRPW